MYFSDGATFTVSDKITFETGTLIARLIYCVCWVIIYRDMI